MTVNGSTMAVMVVQGLIENGYIFVIIMIVMVMVRRSVDQIVLAVPVVHGLMVVVEEVPVLITKDSKQEAVILAVVQMKADV